MRRVRRERGLTQRRKEAKARREEQQRLYAFSLRLCAFALNLFLSLPLSFSTNSAPPLRLCVEFVSPNAKTHRRKIVDWRNLLRSLCVRRMVELCAPYKLVSNIDVVHGTMGKRRCRARGLAGVSVSIRGGQPPPQSTSVLRPFLCSVCPRRVERNLVCASRVILYN